MVQDSRTGDGDGAGGAAPVAPWREAVVLARFNDCDAPSGEEPIVPILYEPG